MLFNVKGVDPEKFTAAVFKIEGSAVEVENQRENLRTLSKKHGGVLAGESTGKSGYLATMVIAYIRELIFTQNVLGETMETAVPWSKINQVKSEAHKLIVQLHKENKLPKVLVSVHFAGQPTKQEMIWNLAQEYDFKIIEDASHSLGSKRKSTINGS